MCPVRNVTYVSARSPLSDQSADACSLAPLAVFRILVTHVFDALVNFMGLAAVALVSFASLGSLLAIDAAAHPLAPFFVALFAGFIAVVYERR